MQRKTRFQMLAVLGSTLLLASCGMTTVSGGTDTACGSFEPISWSQSDTDETIAQVKGHNAAWKAVCRRK